MVDVETKIQRQDMQQRLSAQDYLKKCKSYSHVDAASNAVFLSHEDGSLL